jgi:hypothetical protein
MSLAMYAAPFNNDNNDVYNDSNDTPIARKRTTTQHNKTQKRVLPPDHNSSKVNAVLQSIHNSNEESELGDYKLIPPPSSAGVENTKIKEGMSNSNYSSATHQENDDIDLNSLKENYMNNQAVEKYYKNLIPNYNQNKNNPQIPNYNQPEPLEHSDNYNSLVNKLNYMINLLEEQQDEKTNNVTEEVVLYSFLGIFIIFIVDSFARVGKYVR